MRLIKYFSLLFLILCFSKNINAQGITNLWLLGYSEDGGDFGGSNIDFYFNNADTSRVHRPINFGFDAVNISDSLGQLLFCTNGFDVANRHGDTMSNGFGLYGSDNPTGWSRFGGDFIQGCIILPDPGNTNHYYIFHETGDLYVSFIDYAGMYPRDLYCSEVDLTLNSGLGEVINKNTVILHDTLTSGQLTACKHANGRDYWLIVPELKRPSYYSYLLTPAGLQLMGSQSIGIRTGLSGQCAFSPDGNTYAYYNWYSGLEVFDFDRCSGTFSNARLVTNVDTMETGWGLAFSPDSRKIYLSSGLFLHQFNLDDTSLAASNRIIGIWDGFYDQIPFGTMFGFLQLAPDGKIYISTGNGSHYLHCIENPNVVGVGCDLVQRKVKLPTWNYNSFPNHPNYFLGAVSGSNCDTITDVNEVEIRKYSISAYPNPVVAGGSASLVYPTLKNAGAVLELFNISGQKISEYELPQWSQNYRLKIPDGVNGLVLLKIRTGEYVATAKLVVIGK